MSKTFKFVCLSVCLCLSVCPQHNSKTNNPKVFKLRIGNDVGIYDRSDMVLGVSALSGSEVMGYRLQ